MQLAISNIGWRAERDLEVYSFMKNLGYTGLEIAPTRIFPKDPYNKGKCAFEWKENIQKTYGFRIPSMQSIWYGRTEKLFGSEKEREILVDYTQKAIDFAHLTECGNLVFGCPKNRVVLCEEDKVKGIEFFKEVGNYALQKGTIIGIEANPPIYNTNYINTTKEAFSIVEEIGLASIRVNLDLGTMIQNEEQMEDICGNVKYISHVHISEPGLCAVKERTLHKEVLKVLREENYSGYVSVEMACTDDMLELERCMRYVAEVFRE